MKVLLLPDLKSSQTFNPQLSQVTYQMAKEYFALLLALLISILIYIDSFFFHLNTVLCHLV